MGKVSKNSMIDLQDMKLEKVPLVFSREFREMRYFYKIKNEFVDSGFKC